MRYNNSTLLTGTLTASFTTDPIELNHSQGYSVSLHASGNVVYNGTFALQSSNNSTQFTNIDTKVFSASGETNHTWNVDAAYYRWARVDYTHVTGSGDSCVVQISVTKKGF